MPLKNGLPTQRELMMLAETDLIDRIDQALDGSVTTWRTTLAQIYRDELVRRRQESASGSMLAWTRQVRNMTLVIVLLTIINVIVAFRYT